MLNSELDLDKHTDAMDVSLALDPVKLQNDTRRRSFDVRGRLQQPRFGMAQQENGFGKAVLKKLLSKSYQELSRIGGRRRTSRRSLRTKRMQER